MTLILEKNSYVIAEKDLAHVDFVSITQLKRSGIIKN